jgi:hypothetical protein
MQSVGAGDLLWVDRWLGLLVRAVPRLHLVVCSFFLKKHNK